MNRIVVPFVSGFLFAAGLAVAGMTDPSRIVAFLDVTGEWDPSLMLVMVGAVSVYALTRAFTRKLSRPLAADCFVGPKAKAVDGRLLLGAAIFGVGWGLAGYCPGPALAAAGASGGQAIAFSSAMVAAFALTRMMDGRAEQRRTPGTSEERR